MIYVTEETKVGLGVFVCVFNMELSKILLVKRNAEKRKRLGAEWGNVGGKIEPNETSLHACIREASEEIGLKLRPLDLHLIDIRETPNFFPNVHKVHFVYTTKINEDSKITLNDESEGYKWFDVKELPDKMLDSKIDILNWWGLSKELDTKDKKTISRANTML